MKRDAASHPRPAPSRFRRVYGAGPLHLLVTAACLALVGLGLAAWVGHGGTGAAQTGNGGGGGMVGMNMGGAGTSPVPAQATVAAPSGGAVPVRRAGNCTPRACPIPTPGPDELSVAGQLGSALAALWITPTGDALQGRLELLNANMGPVAEVARIAGARTVRGCGPGCQTFTLPRPTAVLRVSAHQRGRRYQAQLPTTWRANGSAAARQILERSLGVMRSLLGVRISESLTAGPPGPVEHIRYRLSAPDRMAYTMNTGVRNVTIAGTTWSYTPGQGWQRSSYGSGRFTTAAWYDWDQYDQSIQLLGETRDAADIALMDPGLPVWFRLHIDLGTGTVGSVLMIAGGHFMTDRYQDYGVTQPIAPPRS